MEQLTVTTEPQVIELNKLPPKRQTQVVRQAIRTGQDTVYITLPDYGNCMVDLPSAIKVSFQCDQCNHTHDVLFYKGDVVKNHVARAVRCPQRGCKGTAHISFMGARF